MSSSPKILAFDDLVRTVETLRTADRAVVHCHGVFDLLHIGHIRYFQAARRLGDTLVVTVTPDGYVNKGPHRPVFDERLRTEAIASLDCVDYVAVNRWPTAVEALRQLRPRVYAKGGEYRDGKTPELLAEEAEAAALGIRVEFVEDDVTSSSTYLINHFFSPFSEEVDRYLTDVRRRWNAAQLLDRLRRARALRVLVVGEAILDEYVECSTLGQSTKTPNVVGQFLREERFPGGALAVANHLAGFCDRVELIAMVGRDAPSRRWIGEHLRPEVQWRPLVRPDAPTVVKRQYRDSYLGLPLFEVDYLDDAPLDAARRAELVDMLAAALPAADLVLVADQGHGMLDDHTIPLLCDTARYLAVTTPASAANLGFHTISKYRRADHLTLAEQDLRLDRRSRCGNAEQMLVEIADRLQAREATLTVGNKGCVCYRPGQGLVTAPALATRVVDRLGAGAAAFAVTGLAAALDFPLDQLAFLSNVAGAQAVAVVGHSRFLDEGSFGRHVESLLK